MSDIQVTRRDLEMAAEAYVHEGSYNHPDHIAEWSDCGSWPVREPVEDWGDPVSDLVEARVLSERVRLERLARGYAQARAEGVASERARWIAEADRAEAWFEHQADEAGRLRKERDCLIPQFHEGREDAWEASALRMREMKATMTKEPGHV